jgi:hypothetical protein
VHSLGAEEQGREREREKERVVRRRKKKEREEAERRREEGGGEGGADVWVNPTYEGEGKEEEGKDGGGGGGGGGEGDSSDDDAHMLGGGQSMGVDNMGDGTKRRSGQPGQPGQQQPNRPNGNLTDLNGQSPKRRLSTDSTNANAGSPRGGLTLAIPGEWAPSVASADSVLEPYIV